MVVLPCAYRYGYDKDIEVWVYGAIGVNVMEHQRCMGSKNHFSGGGWQIIREVDQPSSIGHRGRMASHCGMMAHPWYGFARW